MRVVLGLLALVWLQQTPWAQVLLVGAILAAVAVVAWVVVHNVLYVEPEPVLRVEPHFETRRGQDDPSPERSRLLSRIASLEADLEAARAEIDALRSRNAQLEADLSTARTTASRGSANPLFRRVGLHEDAPEWVVVAVRRAYRKRLHPDAHPADTRVEAERRFKEAEGVFEEIWRLKALQ